MDIIANTGHDAYNPRKKRLKIYTCLFIVFHNCVWTAFISRAYCVHLAHKTEQYVWLTFNICGVLFTHRIIIGWRLLYLMSNYFMCVLIFSICMSMSTVQSTEATQFEANRAKQYGSNQKCSTSMSSQVESIDSTALMKPVGYQPSHNDVMKYDHFFISVLVRLLRETPYQSRWIFSVPFSNQIHLGRQFIQ